MPALNVAINSHTGRRIGLLGGSFNPAHRGHLHISESALNTLALDEVWWLVSPQNPLKSEDGMAPLDERLAQARDTASGTTILVTDIERELGTRYSADTVAALKDKFPAVRFVWFMGADNLIQIHRWRHWTQLFRTVPVAVFARPTYALRAVKARAARRFARFQLKSRRAAELADQRPPAWVYLRDRLDPTSATEIRNERMKGAKP